MFPGAAFVEIAAMAAEKILPGTGAVILGDLVLIQPLVIASEERLVLSVVFDEKSDCFSVYSSSDADTAMRSEWIAENAQGNARRRDFRLLRAGPPKVAGTVGRPTESNRSTDRSIILTCDSVLAGAVSIASNTAKARRRSRSGSTTNSWQISTNTPFIRLCSTWQPVPQPG